MPRTKVDPIQLDIRSIMNDVARDANKQVAKQLKLWSRNVGRNVTRGQGLTKLNKDMASESRSRILEAYKTSGFGLKKSYRYNDRGKFRRYSNKRMEKALKDPKTIYADERGIHFINMERMDYWAKQWYRLNFGTQSGGTKKAPTAKPMTILGVQTRARVSLDQWPASEDFKIPRGFWSMTFAPKTSGTRLRKPLGSGDAFYAARKDKRQRAIPSKNTKISPALYGRSIKGKRFIDVGASYINANYGRRFSQLAKTWLTN